MAYSKPENKNKTPIVFLGGAFQNFKAFKREVSSLTETHPVILLDLPSQGSNQQLTPELNFKDFAGLLHGFCNHFKLDKIIPIAFSYGSAIGYYFASLYPERTEKLILGGCMPRMRDGLKHLLTDSIEQLELGNYDSFAQGAVMNLVNFVTMDKTNMSSRMLKSFYKNMQALDENARARYKQNTQRLLNMEELEGTPTCETLVLAGEYDNFTYVHENYEVACRCSHSQFAIVKNGDHLANIQRKDVMIGLYKTFLNGEKIVESEGVSVPNDHQVLRRDKRINERYAPHRKLATITLGKRTLLCEVMNLSYGGCEVYIDSTDKSKFQAGEFVQISIVDTIKLELHGYLLPNGKNFKIIFRHDSFNRASNHLEYLKTLSKEPEIGFGGLNLLNMILAG